MSQILIASDDAIALAITETALQKWSFQMPSDQDGETAWPAQVCWPGLSPMIVETGTEPKQPQQASLNLKKNKPEND